MNEALNIRRFFKAFGPGLLFASAAIGTSHLVFATKAGAEYGMIFLPIIIGALIFNYPFFEFAGRYANATGRSLFHGYRRQHPRWLKLLCVVLLVNVVGNAALVTVSEGLLATALGTGTAISILGLSVPLWFLLLAGTWAMLLIGRFRLLDVGIKALAAVLFVSVLATFALVMMSGRIDPVESFEPRPLLSATGIALLIALMGYMPTPMYVSMFQSVWSEAKYSISSYRPTLREQLLDFRIGYGFTLVMAFTFLIIGVYTLYGSGQELSDNNAAFSAQVVGVFTTHIGEWAFPIVAVAAFATIYGTFISSFDAFGRCITAVVLMIRAGDDEEGQRSVFDRAQKFYPITLSLIACYVMFVKFVVTVQFGVSMGEILRVSAIIAFLCSPLIAFLNYRSVFSGDMPESHRPSAAMRNWSKLGLAYISIIAVVFVIYRSVA